MLSKMDGIWAPRPTTGPHKLAESLPIILILRNRLKYALTGKETKQICMEKHVKVDGKVRTDPTFPAGFMDVVEIAKSGDRFRLLDFCFTAWGGKFAAARDDRIVEVLAEQGVFANAARTRVDFALK